MLHTLGPAPQTLLPRPVPPGAAPTRPRWFTVAPTQVSTEVQLAPGVWIVPNRRWMPAPASDTTDPEVAESPARSWRYTSTNWHRRALCAKLPLDLSDPLFFGADDNVPPEGLIIAVNAARRVCSICPVARQCLADALLTDQRYGVRAGTSGRERGKLRLRLAAGATVTELVDECLTP